MPFAITFCLPRPDIIDDQPVTIDDPETLQVIDVFAELADGCLAVLDRAMPATGTATFAGYCEDGLAEAGYTIGFDATIPVTRMCDGQSTTIALSGRADVEALSF